MLPALLLTTLYDGPWYPCHQSFFLTLAEALQCSAVTYSNLQLLAVTCSYFQLLAVQCSLTRLNTPNWGNTVPFCWAQHLFDILQATTMENNTVTNYPKITSVSQKKKISLAQCAKFILSSYAEPRKKWKTEITIEYNKSSLTVL